MGHDRHFIEGDCFDDIYRDVISNLVLHPQYICSPRGSKVKENIGVTLKLNNPRARLITIPSRDVNYGFGVGEFLWYWQGKRDLETMVYYNKRMKNFSDDGKTLTSAYGYRMKEELVASQYTFRKGLTEFDDIRMAENQSISQWEVAKRTLIADPDSRRCVLHINRPFDQLHAVIAGSKDVPCTLSLQFFIRNGKLELHTHMRSNDVFWGLTYDLFSFTLFQECMLLELQREDPKFSELKLGSYYHTAGSLHIYETHFKQAEDACRDYIYKRTSDDVMEPLDLDELKVVCTMEEYLRTNSYSPLNVDGEVSGSAKWMINQLSAHRAKRNLEKK